MERIVIIGSGRTARLMVERLLSRAPGAALTLFAPGAPESSFNWLRPGEVELRLEAAPVSIDRFSRTVTTTDGYRTGFQRLVLACSKTTPGLARAAKLDVQERILVNSHMQTSDGYIYAVGECAESAIGTPMAPIDDQADIVAAHICASGIFTEVEFALTV
jgi:NAD(P)H-nitrite reductase large subunit